MSDTFDLGMTVLGQIGEHQPQEVLRCPKCTGLLALATAVCTVCGHDPFGYYCDEWDHARCEHTR